MSIVYYDIDSIDGTTEGETPEVRRSIPYGTIDDTSRLRLMAARRHPLFFGFCALDGKAQFRLPDLRLMFYPVGSVGPVWRSERVST